MAEVLIKASELVKEFGRNRALNGASLEIKSGEFVTLFGPNGAGKTTLLRILSTVIASSRGEVWVGGYSLKENSLEARRLIGFVSHYPLLYDDLTSEENLSFYGKMYGLKDAERRVDAFLKKVGLYHRKYDLVRTFSRGMLQRLAIARALLHDPLILLLDEPYTGLDPAAALILNQLLGRLRKEGHTFLMTSHDIEQGFKIATRIAILAEGKVVFEAPKKKLSLTKFRQIYWEKTEKN